MANSGKVNICNIALSLIKANNRILDITEDSTEANLCNILFDDSLDAVLEMHPWNFAINRASLAQSVITPTYEYDYQYALPTDPYCLRVIEVVDSSGDKIEDYEVEGRYLLTDENAVYIKYVGRITNYNNLSTLFRRALAYYLASELAEPITSSTKTSEIMYVKFEEILKKAIKVDSRQAGQEEESINNYSWDVARF